MTSTKQQLLLFCYKQKKRTFAHWMMYNFKLYKGCSPKDYKPTA